MMWRLAVLALVGATAVAALLLGRRRTSRAARLRRRAERQARRAGTALAPATHVYRPSSATMAPAGLVAHDGPELGDPDAKVPEASPIDAGTPEAGFRSIRGIGAALEDRLRSAGVTSVAQVAAWSDTDIEAIAPLLRVKPDRVRSQAWVEQARALMGGSPS